MVLSLRHLLLRGSLFLAAGTALGVTMAVPLSAQEIFKATGKDCPSVEYQARQCKNKGVGFTKILVDGCWQAQCKPQKNVKCLMPIDQVKAKVARCEETPGFVAVVKTEGACSEFLYCVEGKKKIGTDLDKETKPVSCTKILEGTCTFIRCDDGFTLNSCDVGQCKALEMQNKKIRVQGKEEGTQVTCSVTPNRDVPGCWQTECPNEKVTEECVEPGTTKEGAECSFHWVQNCVRKVCDGKLVERICRPTRITKTVK